VILLCIVFSEFDWSCVSLTLYNLLRNVVLALHGKCKKAFLFSVEFSFVAYWHELKSPQYNVTSFISLNYIYFKGLRRNNTFCMFTISHGLLSTRSSHWHNFPLVRTISGGMDLVVMYYLSFSLCDNFFTFSLPLKDNFSGYRILGSLFLLRFFQHIKDSTVCFIPWFLIKSMQLLKKLFSVNTMSFSLAAFKFSPL
jgi:hypothetical protein